MRRALVIVSKFDVGRPSGKLKLPPNNCIPSKANIKINRKRSRRRERMDDMALVRATTKLRSEDQYLNIIQFKLFLIKRTFHTYLVTLNTRSSLRALRADIPKLLALGE